MDCCILRLRLLCILRFCWWSQEELSICFPISPIQSPTVSDSAPALLPLEAESTAQITDPKGVFHHPFIVLPIVDSFNFLNIRMNSKAFGSWQWECSSHFSRRCSQKDASTPQIHGLFQQPVSERRQRCSAQERTAVAIRSWKEAGLLSWSVVRRSIDQRWGQSQQRQLGTLFFPFPLDIFEFVGYHCDISNTGAYTPGLGGLSPLHRDGSIHVMEPTNPPRRLHPTLLRNHHHSLSLSPPVPLQFDDDNNQKFEFRFPFFFRGSQGHLNPNFIDRINY